MFTAIYIDDDKRSIDLMKAAISGVPEFDLIASFTSGNEALQWLDSNEVNIVFLDIEMPEKNGLELATDLIHYTLDIIFLTAHTDFAIKAFEACALDYLVKPIYTEKLRAALERYTYRKDKTKATDVPFNIDQINELFSHYMRTDTYPKRLFVNMVGETRVVILANVLYFIAFGPYTKIILESGEIITVSENIKIYSDVLQRHPDFVRIHRSYLINKQYISSIQRKVGSCSVKMINGEMLAVAQQRRNEIFKEIIS